MASIHLDQVSKRFGNVQAVDRLNLNINDGEFFCVLGPPGAGKTTTLRLIVGLERPDEGTILVDGQPVNDVHPGQRDIAMMFQNLALYPDKTVFNNIAYPLRERKMPKPDIEQRVRAVARTLYIDHLLDRKPAKLSGGERQRVALGRVIVRQPRAMLMDEPLANLDALLRLEMRVELKRLQKDLGVTLVYVTHDQIEAMSMADRIAVLNHGVLQQCDVPDAVYNYPENCFVATTVGSPPMNLLRCEVYARDGGYAILHTGFQTACSGDGASAALASHASNGGDVLVGFRPEDLELLERKPKSNAFPVEVSVIEPLGSETILDLLAGGEVIKAVIPPQQQVSVAQQLWARPRPDQVHLFDARTEARFFTTGAEPFTWSPATG